MRRKRPKRSPCRLAALVGSLLVATAAGPVASEHDSKARTISVVGTGEVSVTPDLALLSVAVETTGRTAEEATRTNAQKSTQVLWQPSWALVVTGKLAGRPMLRR